ncbi:MAG: GNAT family N-acetyltransferase [Firmicutes bacterium]|nr:GNAT family N-acetyltransferase [Bacillota bacterium]
MTELDASRYSTVKGLIPLIKCDNLWAYSIVENPRLGRVFVDDINAPETALFWHFCGDAFIAGPCENGDVIRTLGEFFRGTFEHNRKRFALYVNGEQCKKAVADIAKTVPSVQVYERYMFRFNEKTFRALDIAAPAGYALREIDREIYDRLRGGILPKFFWDSPEAFLKAGKGYCMLGGEDIACHSFGAAVGNGTVDVGIETAPEHRGKGLAVPTAYAMVKYCADNGLTPNWGCGTTNAGSARIAQILGFEAIGAHPVYITEERDADNQR